MNTLYKPKSKSKPLQRSHQTLGLMMGLILGTSLLFPASTYASSHKSIAQLASESQDFKVLVFLLKRAGLVDVLNKPGAFTVFAPTDAAFNQIPRNDLISLYNHPEELKKVLLQHVVAGKYNAESIKKSPMGKINTQNNGDEIFVNNRGNDVFINVAKVQKADINASNGIIHAVDKVLLPSERKGIYGYLQADDDFDTLTFLIKRAGLDEVLNSSTSFTVFAPTDEAFDALGTKTLQNLYNNPEELKKLLLQHVVLNPVLAKDLIKTSSFNSQNSGNMNYVKVNGSVYINGDAKVIGADMRTRNGIIHKIDKVLVPTERRDVYETAKALGSFDTLAFLIDRAGLKTTLMSTGPFTVLAPTDETFQSKLTKQDFDSLYANPDRLAEILKYHVLVGEFTAADLANTTTATNALGQIVNVKVDGDNNLIIDGNIVGQVAVANVITENGIIHAINTVLIP